VIFLIQSFLGEEDYSSRIGVNYSNLTSKALLIKYFILNLFRAEVLTFIGICLILFLYLKKILNKDKIQISVFVIFIISSFFSTIFFIAASNKIISLYHFANIFLFSFVLFIFISFVFIINYFNFFKNLLTKFKFIIYLLLFFLGLIFSSSNLLNKDLREGYVKVDSILKQLKSNHQDTYLFTNDLRIQTGWLFNGFSSIYLTNGFNNSLNNNQIEDSFSKILRHVFKENSEFNKILDYKNEKDNHRNSLISYFLNQSFLANYFYQLPVAVF
jgi:hypothetical protein